ncbi:ABC-F family ATP-binding cassette domain-containing protein [Saccharicrinis sp. FJH62]|uniref:ABC-F family ATP-binding cassette domain-containing protein n=1 Tax=Saccharicrinis sp. FJH62 TaxID=3344657 RepID=UPI0035D4AD19
MGALLEVKDLSKYWGEILMFDAINFTLADDSRMALIARNGTGKTSLLNILTGLDIADSGTVNVLPDVTIGYLKQDIEFDPELTVVDTLFDVSNKTATIVRDYEEAVESNDPDRIQKAVDAMDVAKAWDYEVRIKQVLTKLKIPRFEQKVGQLSGGQKKRLALAVILISEPDLMILDEPTNHLDLDMIEWLEEYLQRMSAALFMVTHDRYFLDRVCNQIIELEDQTIYTYQGNYSYFLKKREERIEVMKAEVEKAQNLLRTEQDWMNRMPKARSHKAKYRIDNYYNLKDKASQRFNEDQVDIRVKSSRMGKKIIELKHISKSFGSLTILDDFSYIFSRFEKLGIVGENGTGKSTFLNILTGALKADSGTIDTGETINIGYFRQDGMDFSAGKKVIEVITDISEHIELGDGHKVTPAQYLNHFLFPNSMHHVLVEKLSGGEKRRLYLMTVLMKNPNFLILDEPTNDLDIMTLGILESYLQDFQGSLIVVSHDRFFMDSVVDHLFVFEGNAVVRDFPGNYTEFRQKIKEEQRHEQLEEQKQKESDKKPEPKKATNKLTWKERKEMEALEQKISVLETEKTEIESALSSGNLGNDELMEKSNRIQSIMDELDEAEMRWLELSEKDQ